MPAQSVEKEVLCIEGSNSKRMLTDVHFIRNGTKKPVIIYIHGFNGFKDWGNFDLLARFFASHHFFFVKMNLSHNGTTVDSPEEFVDLESYGNNNYSKELYDVEKVIDWAMLQDNAFYDEMDCRQIILLGHSRGGGIALLKAAEDKRVNAVITWASVGECKTPWGNWDKSKMEQWRESGIAFIDNKRTAQRMPLHYQLYQDYIKNQNRFSIESAVKGLNIPVQFCHGTQDEAVPFSVLGQFQKWKPDAHFVSLHSNHVFGRSHPYVQAEIPHECMEVMKQNLSFLKVSGFSA